MLIVPFEATDQDEVRSLVLDGLAEHWGVIDESLNSDLADIAGSYANRCTLVGRRAGSPSIIATGTIVKRPGSSAEIVWLSVAATHRGQGIGRAVVRELLERARSFGVDHVICETLSAWTEVVGFWRSCGFEVTHRTVGAHGEDTWFGIEV